jgi:hypothetical protein
MIEHLRQRLRYDPLTGELWWIEFNKRAGTAPTATRKYRRVMVERVEYLEHVLIWALVTGAWPTLEVDHEDKDGSNNRWANLRELSRGDNQRNTRMYSNNKSGFRGVSRASRGSKWVASIRIAGKQHHLGQFDDPALASAVYQAARQDI